MNGSPTVCFVTLVLTHYRVPFHNRVREILAAHNIDYRLIYSDPTGDAAAKNDTSSLDWAIRVPVTSFKFLGQTFHWQSVRRYVKGSDLTIVSQESKLLLNYRLHADYALRGRKFGYFGHGRNFQSTNPRGLRAAWKRFLATRVHWWFAYTPGVADIVRQYGFPEDKISINYNAIDTIALERDLQSVTGSDIEAMKTSLGIATDNIGIYIGGMYAEKRLPFLLEAVERVREKIPDFELVLVGSGSHAYLADEAAREHPFVHYLGPRFGYEKAVLLKMSKVFLMPGLVGLGVLDTFTASCPLITTNVSNHSPEIEYLTHGENGVLVRDPDNVDDYCQAIVRIMTDDRYWHILKNGCRASAQNYSIENMAQHFCEGVLKAIADGSSGSRVIPRELGFSVPNTDVSVFGIKKSKSETSDL